MNDKEKFRDEWDEYFGFKKEPQEEKYREESKGYDWKDKETADDWSKAWDEGSAGKEEPDGKYSGGDVPKEPSVEQDTSDTKWAEDNAKEYWDDSKVIKEKVDAQGDSGTKHQSLKDIKVAIKQHAQETKNKIASVKHVKEQVKQKAEEVVLDVKKELKSFLEEQKKETKQPDNKQEVEVVVNNSTLLDKKKDPQEKEMMYHTYAYRMHFSCNYKHIMGSAMGLILMGLLFFYLYKKKTEKIVKMIEIIKDMFKSNTH